MTSKVVAPASNLGGLGSQQVMDALIGVALEAKADIEALQAGTGMAAATTTTAGSQSAADKKFEDGLHSAATALTDAASQTLASPSGVWGTLPTLSQGGTLTLGTTGAVAGDQFYFTRTSTSANTYAIVNGGNGSGTLITFATSKIGCGVFQFDGTDWKLKSFGIQ